MNKKWSILFCAPDFKPCPIVEFLESCRPAHQIKVLHFLELLEEAGPILPRPYADLLHDGIHELRIKLSGDQIRLMYFFCFETCIVLYQVLKKQGSMVPENFIQETLRYRQVLLSRFDRDELEKHAQFRTYLYRKCSDRGFKEQYERLCTVCTRTAAVVSTIYERGIPMEEMARQTGIPVKTLTKIETADRCNFDDLRKICRVLDIEEPERCVKKGSKTERFR